MKNEKDSCDWWRYRSIKHVERHEAIGRCGSNFTLKPHAGRSRPNFLSKQSYLPPLKILVPTPET